MGSRPERWLFLLELKEIYVDICNQKGWKLRSLLVRALEVIEDFFSREEPFILMLSLPTGYGKTTLTETLFKYAIKNGYFFSKVIHVLPMRSIVDDLARKLKAEFGEDQVAAQHMGLHESPFLAKPCVVTTLDTFILNFVKIPTVELRKAIARGISHHDFARGMIYSSLVVFDEFHLFSGLGSLREEMKSLEAAVASIVCLSTAGVPVVVATATLPTPMRNYLMEKAEEVVEVEEIRFGERLEDESFSRERKAKTISLRIEDKCLEEVLQAPNNTDKRILIILNTVSEAVNIYRKIKNHNVVLLHGKLPERRRKEVIKRILKDNPRIIVATQVVEAGVDISYDILITAPCPVDRLIQRAGRVARHKGDNEGEVIIVLKASKGPYDAEIVDMTVQKVKLLDNQSLNKLEFDKKMEEFLNQIYSKVYLEPTNEIYEVIMKLDEYVFLAAKDAIKAIEAFCGFTDSFGIVSAFPESKPLIEYAIGLSEREAKNALWKYRKVLTRGEIQILDEKNVRKLLRGGCLSLKLLRGGFEGIVIPDFDEELGFVGFNHGD
ncbi:MAG: CRISPR-associated helicase Cas3' [Thermoprotei archaeon]|nr:MAG: CRISPR-associated helicase Cas3' [Thermoprotei archaeon]